MDRATARTFKLKPKHLYRVTRPVWTSDEHVAWEHKLGTGTLLVFLKRARRGSPMLHFLDSDGKVVKLYECASITYFQEAT